MDRQTPNNSKYPAYAQHCTGKNYTIFTDINMCDDLHVNLEQATVISNTIIAHFTVVIKTLYYLYRHRKR